MTEHFREAARKVATAVGSPFAFAIAFAGVLAWILSGPAFHYSDTWQLAINTSTTIVTFLMVFLIQNSQNHDSRALHLKLDELIRAVSEARTGLVDLENLPESELCRLEAEFQKLRMRPARSAS